MHINTFINRHRQASHKNSARLMACLNIPSKQIVWPVVIFDEMLQDLFRIQAALGGSSSQSGTNMHRRFKPDEQKDEEATDFGLEGPEPDSLVYSIAGTTTMDWLKSHHLIDLS